LSLLQKYRKEETRKTTPEEEKKTKKKEKKEKKNEKSVAPKEKPKKTKSKKSNQGVRKRPVISATIRQELVEALTDLTEEKYLNRSKFIEDALVRTIKVEFPDIAERYDF
jgi:outer membrane biosynthesis protein TonB